MLRKFSTFLFLSTVIACAAETDVSESTVRVMQITLPEAVQAALQKNFTLQERSYDPRIATERLRSVRGIFDPSLDAAYRYRYNKSGGLAADITGSATFVPLFRTDSHEASLGLVGKTPFGTSYDIGGTTLIEENARRNFTRYDTFLGISLTQPLLKNFGTGANMAAIRIARADLSISDWALRQEMINVITDCIHAYSELCYAIEYLDVEERSRELASQLVDDNTKRWQIGTMIPLDVFQARGELASREERVLVAQRNVADRENALKQILSDEVHTLLGLRVRPAAPQLPKVPHPDVKKDIVKALDLRPDYRQALLAIQKQNITVVYSRNQALPRLDLVASFGFNGIDTKLGDSLVRAAGVRDNNIAASVGAVFSVPIPNNENLGSKEAAKLQIAKSLVALKRLEQNIIIDIDNAAGRIETVNKRVEASTVARKYAAATLDAANKRYDAQTGTTFEILQFQRDLANAEGIELRARADYINALADYASVTATTLESNNVILDVADKQVVKKKK